MLDSCRGLVSEVTEGRKKGHELGRRFVRNQRAVAQSGDPKIRRACGPAARRAISEGILGEPNSNVRVRDFVADALLPSESPLSLLIPTGRELRSRVRRVGRNVGFVQGVSEELGGLGNIDQLVPRPKQRGR